MSLLEIKKTPSGEIFARRKDGKPLTEADKAKAKRIAASEPAPEAGLDTIIDDTVVAVLIDSTVLGAPIWFALRDDWKPDPGDTIPVFYASELPALCTKTPQELRNIFNVNSVFGGGRVIQ